MHERREPQRHLLEKNGTWKFCKKFWEFLRNFRRNIPEKFLWISWEKFSGISWNLFSYLIPLKIRKHGDQVLRISQEFPENQSGEILRIFLGWNSREIPRNFSKLILLINSPKNPLTWWPSPKNFSGISGEVFQRNSEEFFPNSERKLEKQSFIGRPRTNPDLGYI